MSNKNLFKEAIADAKAVREAALLNAKNALEEALTPSIQNMLAAKLNEMSDDYGMEEEMIGMDREEAPMEEDFDLASILAELELEEETELAEAKKEKTKDEEGEEGEEEEGEEEEKGEEEGEEEVEVKDMSIEDLKALIKDVVSQELEAEPAAMPAGEEEMDMDMNMGDMGNMEADEEEINLEELLAELDSLDEEAELEEAKKMKNKDKEAKEELEEAINVIKSLRTQLSETNLLNAKLLYVNKIFKAKNLSEAQKLNVIASFDKATTAKEAKMVYESLNTTLTNTVKRTAIKESLGFASKATGIAPKKQIVESNDVISRMQKLANIIK
jgi:hypothetical protein